MSKTITDAIRNTETLNFYYDGGTRTVEPHCFGTTTAGNPGLRGYQTAGYSSSGSLGWKMFDMSKASNIKPTGGSFSGPRAGYKKGDRGMSAIVSEL
jgi:hypothetical protein